MFFIWFEFFWKYVCIYIGKLDGSLDDIIKKIFWYFNVRNVYFNVFWGFYILR